MKATDSLKRFLRSAWYWQNKKNYLSDKILVLRSQAEKTTTSFSDAPTFGGYEDHRQQIIEEMVEKQRQYAQANKECETKLQEIRLFIGALEDYQERLILEMRYLHFENWQDIALRLNYTERQIYNMHGTALLHLLDVHKLMIKNSGKALF